MTDYGRFAIFSIVFSISYTAFFYFNVTLFIYFPLVHEIHFGPGDRSLGPPISWYGWVALATLVSLAVALIVPRRWGNRLSPTLAWLVPVFVLVAVLIYEKRWFV